LQLEIRRIFSQTRIRW